MANIKVLMKVPYSEINETMIMKVSVVEAVDLNQPAELVREISDEMDELSMYNQTLYYSYTNELPVIGCDYYALFLPDHVKLTYDMDVVSEWRMRYECPFLDANPCQPLGCPNDWLLATHEIVGHPTRVVQYSCQASSIIGALVVTTQNGNGHPIHCHYHDQLGLLNIKDSIELDRSCTEENVHFFGYYKNGSFRIVAERSPEHAENDRHLFIRLECNRFAI